MIAVVIPAHNEERHIGQCLRSIRLAAQCPRLGGERVTVFLALDRCNDATAAIATKFDVEMLIVNQSNVGAARSIAARAAIEAGARWLANTDADSKVPTDWLSAQLALHADAFCGLVDVADWGNYRAEVKTAFYKEQIRCADHPHVYGANLGVRAEWFKHVGGFPEIPAHEDVGLIERLKHAGAHIVRPVSPVVITSARRRGRAPHGFAEYLRGLEERTCKPVHSSSDPTRVV